MQFSGGEIRLGPTREGNERTLEEGVVKVSEPPPNPVYRVDLVGKSSQITAWSRRADARDALLNLVDQLARLPIPHQLDQMRRYEVQDVPPEIISELERMEHENG